MHTLNINGVLRKSAVFVKYHECAEEITSYNFREPTYTPVWNMCEEEKERKSPEKDNKDEQDEWEDGHWLLIVQLLKYRSGDIMTNT